MKTLKKGIGVIGSTTIDQIVGKGQRFLKLGGVTTYAGLTYRRHDIQLDLTDLMKRFKIKESVVTLGKNGGFVQTQNGAMINYGADPVKYQVDPTGAGDVFFAAYIAGRFSIKMPIPEACRYAARIAALQVAGNYVTINQLGLD